MEHIELCSLFENFLLQCLDEGIEVIKNMFFYLDVNFHGPVIENRAIWSDSQSVCEFLIVSYSALCAAVCIVLLAHCSVSIDV